MISENEIIEIKKLYESALPPDESVLVGNINPYKNTEYVSARRMYSSGLKDGDLFFSVKSEYDKFVSDYNQKKINEFLINLKGKTYRVELKDKIYKIDDITNINQYYSTTTFDVVVTDLSTKKSLSGKGEMQAILSRNRNYTENKLYPVSQIRIGLEYVRVGLGGIDRLEMDDPDGLNDSLNKYININLIPEKRSLEGSDIREEIGKISEVPDEYFEIRKIERIKTDY